MATKPRKSDEANDILRPEDMQNKPKATSKPIAKSMQTSPFSDDEQSRRMVTALKGYGAKDMEASRMSDDEQSKRIKTALKGYGAKDMEASRMPSKKTATVTKPAAAPSADDMAREARIKDDEKFFANRGAFKDDEDMQKKTYKSGGAVKSGASRGDGCAIRGRTKGKYC